MLLLALLLLLLLFLLYINYYCSHLQMTSKFRKDFLTHEGIEEGRFTRVRLPADGHLRSDPFSGRNQALMALSRGSVI